MPALAISLKQILHTPNLLKKPRDLPHFQHRLTILVENFGFFNDFEICACVAIIYFIKGKPK
jgi:hypothetical protein